MPVGAVMLGGRPTVSEGSSATMSGRVLGSTMVRLLCAAWSDTTAAMVTSEPEPAVVGTA
jgi:hypothetical protein